MPPFCKRAWHDYDTTKFTLMEELVAHIKAALAVLQDPCSNPFRFRGTDSLSGNGFVYAIVIML